MVERTTDSDVRSPEAVRIRDLLAFADALDGDLVLDGDQIARLCRDLDDIEHYSTLRSRRFDMTAQTDARHRERSMLQAEHRQMEAELGRIRAMSAHADERSAADAAQLRDSAAQHEQMQAESRRISEDYREARAATVFYDDEAARAGHLWDAHAWRETEEGRQRLGVLQQQAHRSAWEAERLRAEVASLEAMLQERTGSLQGTDETGDVSDAVAVADAVQSHCGELSVFLRRGRYDGISAREFVTRLDGPIETAPDDGTGPMTGRAALERLATLADDEDGGTDDW